MRDCVVVDDDHDNEALTLFLHVAVVDSTHRQLSQLADSTEQSAFTAILQHLLVKAMQCHVSDYQSWLKV